MQRILCRLKMPTRASTPPPVTRVGPLSAGSLDLPVHVSYAGTAVVTLDAAALWTDGRYYLQATNQLEKSWILQKTGEKTTPSQADWLVSVLPPSSQVAIDPSLFTVQTIHMLRATLQKAGHSLATHPTNLVDEIWTNRPAAPTSPIVVLDVKYAGKSFTEKLADLRAQLHAGKNWGVVINSLDEICWLFNLRGSDVSFNPVFLAYAIVTSSEAYIYTDLKKVTQSVRDATSGLVTFKEYGDIFNDLSVHGKSRMGQPETLYMDCNCNGALYESFGKAPVFGGKPLIQQAKAIKNATELEGFRQCHKRDGLALCRYFSWLENELVAKANKTLTEAQVADKLEGYRKELDKFVGLSFDTISSTGANGAVIHYKPEHGSCAIVDVNQIYLCDSGAQFLDGTTDTTRTFHFGTPTAEEKDAYTRVLQGHIQIDMLVFPEGTTGYIIDAIARAPLWKAGLDYMHGTGHGVGSYLNVHEGPHGIGFRISQNDTGLQAGMTVTDGTIT